jgi:hypothetical protein
MEVKGKKHLGIADRFDRFAFFRIWIFYALPV